MAVSFMLATTFTLKDATAFNPVLIDDDGTIITNDTEEKLNIMSRENVDLGQIEKEDI
jgi:hypothetical protein